MVAPRRFLPSISMLLAFEAVARHENVSAAARELSLSQGAVSRQVQNLESQLGVSLFSREKKRVHLSAAGEYYAPEIRAALKRIADASLKIRANPDGGTLNLAIVPTFGTLWLAPRLPVFLQKNAGITVNLSTRLSPFDFNKESLDVAIHFGQPAGEGLEYMVMMDEMVIPVCSPQLINGKSIRSAEDLLALPLLQLGTRPNAWEHWLSQNGVESPATTGMLFDQFATMSQAAVYGAGVALLPEYLVKKELEKGLLVSAWGGPTQSVGCYYLTWPLQKTQYMPLVRFRDWLEKEVRTTSDG